MTLEILTPPAVEPVSLADAKAHLRVTYDAEDALITRLLLATRQRVETELGLALITTALRETFSDWGQRLTQRGAARLLRGPLQSVQSIDIADVNGDFDSLDPSRYTARIATRPGLVASVGGAFPAPQIANGGIRIDYTCGFGDEASDVPAPLIQAILALTAHAFEHRDAADPPTALVEPWLAPYRRVRL